MAPEIHQITILKTTSVSISLSWIPPVLHDRLHSRTVEYGILHEPTDALRGGLAVLHRTPSTNITITNLNPASGHGFSVMSRSIAGWSKPSSKLIHFTNPFTPTKPAPLELIRITVNALFVTWFPPDFDNGLRVDFYEIDLRPMSDNDDDYEQLTTNIKGVEEIKAEREHHRHMTAEEKAVDRARKNAELEKSKLVTRLKRLIKHSTTNCLQSNILGLEPGMQYRLKLRAHNELGYSPWSESLFNVCPRDGVRVVDFGDGWADLCWFSPLLNSSMSRAVTAFEVQICVPTGPLQTIIRVYDPDESHKKNIQAVYDFTTLSNTITEPRYRATGLKSGVRYQFRVRSKINEDWQTWDLGAISEIVSTPSTKPGVPFGLEGRMLEERKAIPTIQGIQELSSFELDHGDTFIGITWTSGNSNGASLEGVEVYAAIIRDHKERDVSLAIEAASSICEYDDLFINNDKMLQLALGEEKKKGLKWFDATPGAEVALLLPSTLSLSLTQISMHRYSMPKPSA